MSYSKHVMMQSATETWTRDRINDLIEWLKEHWIALVSDKKQRKMRKEASQRNRKTTDPTLWNVLDEMHQCENVSKGEIIDRDGRAFAMLGPGLACSWCMDRREKLRKTWKDRMKLRGTERWRCDENREELKEKRTKACQIENIKCRENKEVSSL